MESQIRRGKCQERERESRLDRQPELKKILQCCLTIGQRICYFITNIENWTLDIQGGYIVFIKHQMAERQAASFTC